MVPFGWFWGKVCLPVIGLSWLGFLLLGLPTVSSALAMDPNFDTIIPYPRQLAAAGAPVSIADFHILIGPSPAASIGAQEINQRIGSLGGQAIPVDKLDGASLPELPELPELPGGNLIIIATASNASGAAQQTVLANLPGGPVAEHEQGYAIRTEKRSDGSLRLWLVGADQLGTLYAAITTRQLIQSLKGTPALRPATVSDWPDFKLRQIGQPMTEPRRGLWYAMVQYEAEGKIKKAREAATKWIARKKGHYDWMLRAKINWAWSASFLKANQLSKDTTVVRAALKEVNDYGVQRGVRTMVSGTTSVGRFPADKDNPDFSDVAYHSTHHRYFCWSRLKYHREKAERIAQFVADCGYAGFYLHAADGGGWRNPGLWNDRCEQCQQTYGDDHAKADSIVFGIYYDAVRKRVPDCEFAAVVYPYSPEQLDPELVYQDVVKEMGPGPEARKIAANRTGELTQFVQRLDSLLPDDLLVTVREAERSAMDRMRLAWGKRRFHTYYEYAFWKGWQPYFTTAPLWTKTLYYPSHNDMMFGSISGLGWRELLELLGAECAWNVNRPGSKEFTEAAWQGLGTQRSPPPHRKTFALRASRFWFGDKMGPLIAPVFAENISHGFIDDPAKTMGLTQIDDPLATMLAQAAATKRAALSLDKAKAIQEQHSLLKGEDLGFFLNMLLMTHGAAITAQHRSKIMQIEAAINRGDRDGCEHLIAEAREGLKAAAPRWVALYDGVATDQLMMYYGKRRRNPHARLAYLEFEEFRKQVEDLATSYEKKIIDRTMPDWFVKQIDRRRIRVGHTVDRIKVNGQLSEAAWLAAQPISHFINQNQLRLASHETQARLTFDETNLYVAFECHHPAKDDRILISVAKHKNAKESRRWSLGRNGKVLPASSKAFAKTTMANDVWTIELAIPLQELGVKVADWRSCVIQLARHTQKENSSYGYVHGASFKTLKHFVLTEFIDKSFSRSPPELGLNLDSIGFHQETTGTGSGTVIQGTLSVFTDTPLHHVRVKVEARDQDRLLETMVYPVADFVPLIWRPSTPFAMRFPEEVPGVVATFTIESDEGQWGFVRRFGSPRRAETPPDDLFTQGVQGSQAINHPFHFPAPGQGISPWPEGTIEFWIKPRWNAPLRSDGPKGVLNHAIIHMGPIRPDHPTLYNLNSLALVHNTQGFLTGVLASSRYRHRSSTADTRDWQPDHWHHVAIQWKLIDENHGESTTVQIYVDGKLATTETHATPKDTATEPLVPHPFRPPVQIGSMNTGIRPADAAMDELRISSVRRYTSDFEPKKRFTNDQTTLALFHFDGNLQSDGTTELTATIGAAQ